MGLVFAAALVLAAPPADETPKTREGLARHVREMVEDSRAPAELALKQLRALSTKENFKSLGFESLDELPSAELGKPLQNLQVGIGDLRPA